MATKDVATKSPVSNDPAKPATTAIATTGDKDKPVVPEAASAEDEGSNFEEMKNKFKPAKKPVAVPAELLGGLDGDLPARKEIEAQDNEIAKASGKSALPIASVERVGGKKR